MSLQAYIRRYILRGEGNLTDAKIMIDESPDNDIINQRDTTGQTALSMSVMLSDVDVCEFLLRHHANPNICTRTNVSPLFIAVISENINICELLLEYKADVNYSSEECLPPLHESILSGNIQICKLLLDHGAIIDKKNSTGNAALHVAVSSGLPFMVTNLLQSGADPFIQCNGITSYEYAIQNGHNLIASLIDAKMKEYQLSQSFVIKHISNNFEYGKLLDQNIWRLIHKYIR